MRFAHIADTHIRNLKYHKEYRVVFERLYKTLKEEKVDYIVHCGDIAHTKTQISPEFVKMCSDFFKNLADIAPTYIILGNHDGNLRNSNRLDALTPIVESLGHKNLTLLRDSGEVKLKKGFYLNVLSVFDRDNWSKPSNKKGINIALYHGAVSNSKTDVGWTMEHGEDSVDIFDDFDYAFLGDIHKTNQPLDKAGKIRYCGSTVQQNHGETNDKGFLIWDIESKDDYECTHYVLENPKPFITIELTKKGRMPRGTSVPTGARLRLVSNSSLPLDAVRKALDVARVRFKPEAITFLNRADDDSAFENETKSLVKLDLRNIKIQEDLLKQYLEPYEIDDEKLEMIYKLNKKYNTSAESEEEVLRNINWRLKKLEWSNLFNYGEDNKVDFSATNGIVGIFGKNFSGKSSIVDSLLYTMYNSTSKNARKNLNIINQNKDDCAGSIEIDVGQYTYKIERVSEKYTKKLKGKTTLEAKTDLDFLKIDNATGEVQSLNGLSRIDTDKNIKKVFGTLDDFLLTTMASQLGSLSFIGEGSTKRKEILAKFLDLELFERKFKLAKEDFSDIKGALKKLSDKSFDEEIKEARKELVENEIITNRKNDECSELKYDIDSKAEAVNELAIVIDKIPTEVIDIKNVLDKIDEIEKNILKTKEENNYLAQNLTEEKNYLSKIEKFIKGFDVQGLKEKLEIAEDYKSQISDFEKELDVLLVKQGHQENKISLLKEVPCGSEYSSCKFIKDAYKSKTEIDNTLMSIESLTISKKSLEVTVDSLEPDKIYEHMEKYDKILEKKAATQRSIEGLKLSIEKNKTKLAKFKNTLTELNSKKAEYEKNKEAIENLESLLAHKTSIESELVTLNEQYKQCHNDLLELYKYHGSLEQKMTNLKQQKEEYIELENEYSSADLYMRAMHSNGISYQIIKKKLPVINDEISKILANIVEFEVFFEEDGNKLDIMIKHPKHDPRPIEMGSGAEKTIASMAIRLALLNVSTLPKGDIFILDEPGTALDEENMEGFIRILDMIKTQFKTVVLISHLDSLKDCVDSQIIIEKDFDGYAHVDHGIGV
jgi:exonuclease SbcC